MWICRIQNPTGGWGTSLPRGFNFIQEKTCGLSRQYLFHGYLILVVEQKWEKETSSSHITTSVFFTCGKACRSMDHNRSLSRQFVVPSVYQATHAHHLAVQLYHEHTNGHAKNLKETYLKRCWHFPFFLYPNECTVLMERAKTRYVTEFTKNCPEVLVLSEQITPPPEIVFILSLTAVRRCVSAGVDS